MSNAPQFEKELAKLTKKELIHFIAWCFPDEAIKTAKENAHAKTWRECQDCVDIANKI